MLPAPNENISTQAGAQLAPRSRLRYSAEQFCGGFPGGGQGCPSPARSTDISTSSPTAGERGAGAGGEAPPPRGRRRCQLQAGSSASGGNGARSARAPVRTEAPEERGGHPEVSHVRLAHQHRDPKRQRRLGAPLTLIQAGRRVQWRWRYSSWQQRHVRHKHLVDSALEHICEADERCAAAVDAEAWGKGAGRCGEKGV